MFQAINEVAEPCRKAGMEAVNWEPLGYKKAWDIVSALYLPEGEEDLVKIIYEIEEPILPLTDFIMTE
jgi:amidase